MNQAIISDTDTIRIAELDPFFSGWTWNPTHAARQALLENSPIVVTARVDGRLVGIATALTDRGFFAYLSYLEVLPEAQSEGLGSKLVQKVIERIGDQYDLATITDAETVPFYLKSGFENNVAGVHRRRGVLRR